MTLKTSTSTSTLETQEKSKRFYFLNKRWYSKSHKYWLLGHIFNHKGKIAIITACSLGGIALQIFIPFILGDVFEVYIPSKNLELIIRMALFILGLGLARLVINFIASALNEIMAQHVEMKIRLELYENLQTKSMDFHDSAKIGDLMSMATADTRMINASVSPGVRMIGTTVFTLVATFIAMWVSSPTLSLVFLLAMPFYFYFLYKFGKKLLPLSIKRQNSVAKMNAELQENLTGVRVVRTFSGQEREKKKFNKTIKELEEILVTRGIASAYYIPSLIISVVTASIFLGAAYLIEASIIGPILFNLFGWQLTIQPIQIGELITFLTLAGFLGMPTMFLRWVLDMTLLGLAGAERIFRVLSVESEEEGGETILDDLEGSIEFTNVSFSYKEGSLFVVNDVSLKIEPGETVAILGPTGCGKTTLSKLLLRLYTPTKGSILIDGVNIQEWDITALRSIIGVIEQDTFLFSTTIGSNISYGKSDATKEDIIEAAKAAQAHEFIMSFPDGYETMVGERGVTLSGGQKQRIAMARGFILNPKILIMDASASAIDAQTEAKIQKAIEKLLIGRTTLIITHRLSSLKTATKIVFMDKGRILKVGHHDDLIRTFLPYRDIFKRYTDLPPLEADNIKSDSVSENEGGSK